MECESNITRNDDNDELLLEAAKRGHLSVIKVLLQHGANVNVSCRDGYTPLHIAAKYNRKEAVELLVKYGANINARGAKGETPIFMALITQCLEIINIFLNLNASIEDQPELLSLAVEAGFIEVIYTLLQRKFDVNARFLKKCTALHFTTIHSDENGAEIAELLISKGANINAQDLHGRTTLHYACDSEFPKLVETLLYYGSDINIMNSNSFTPLEIAWAEYFESDTYYPYNPKFFKKNEVLHILLCHLVKMKMANLFLNEGNLKVMKEMDEMFNDFENECKQEIARMKSKIFENSSISMYEILANDTKILAKFMNNENIVQELKSNDYKSEFPIYARMIEINFIKGMDRKILFDEAKYNFHFIFKPFNDLPHQCANKILDLLYAEDLLNFEDALNLPDDSLM